jgi:tRNA pseudouridine55 synthase
VAVIVLGSNHQKVKRRLSGVLLFDKPQGFSSNKALQIVKRLYGAEKTGHTGTLDPLASGLLPLMFGEATKFASDLIGASKSYRTIVRLGFASSTGDAEGYLTEFTSRKLETITDNEVRQICEQFVGEIQQIPPMFSALKKNGKPLYEYAREGVEVQRIARRIVIHQLELIRFCCDEAMCSIELEVTCSKGTYIRTLGEDIAKALGTAGYLIQLRRIAVGDLNVESANTLDNLETIGDSPQALKVLDTLLIPVDSLLSRLGSVNLNNEFARRFLHGQRLPLELADASPGRVRVYGEILARDFNGDALKVIPQFMGTGILETDGKGALLRPDRLIQVNI